MYRSAVLASAALVALGIALTHLQARDQASRRAGSLPRMDDVTGGVLLESSEGWVVSRVHWDIPVRRIDCVLRGPASIMAVTASGWVGDLHVSLRRGEAAAAGDREVRLRTALGPHIFDAQAAVTRVDESTSALRWSLPRSAISALASAGEIRVAAPDDNAVRTAPMKVPMPVLARFEICVRELSEPSPGGNQVTAPSHSSTKGRGDGAAWARTAAE